MRITLVGAVESTRQALKTMARCGMPPAVLLTLPEAKSARHSDYMRLRPVAEALGTKVTEIADINSDEALAVLRDTKPDYLFVIGWSQIVKPEVLLTPRLGAIGYHPAALPENRGRAVIPWTILQRRQETGSTLFWLDEGMDSGDILAQGRFEVAPGETATSLYRKHLACLDELLQDVLPKLGEGNAPRTPQDHAQATYCARRTADDGLIDWSLPAEEVWTLVRAVTRPYPGAFTPWDGARLVIWEADFIGDAPYHGLPGQVQALREEGALVQCGDGKHLLLKSVSRDQAPPTAPGLLLKNHCRLGFRPHC
jgi:methionyl-tRNA formyltransferase